MPGNGEGLRGYTGAMDTFEVEGYDCDDGFTGVCGFRKGRGTRDQIANMHWIIKKASEFKKNIYFCFIDYTKAFDCVNHHKLESS